MLQFLHLVRLETLEPDATISTMLFQLATVVAFMAGTSMAAVCTGSSQREEGEVYSVYPASKAVWETEVRAKM